MCFCFWVCLKGELFSCFAAACVDERGGGAVVLVWVLELVYILRRSTCRQCDYKYHKHPTSLYTHVCQCITVFPSLVTSDEYMGKGFLDYITWVFLFVSFCLQSIAPVDNLVMPGWLSQPVSDAGYFIFIVCRLLHLQPYSCPFSSLQKIIMKIMHKVLRSWSKILWSKGRNVLRCVNRFIQALVLVFAPLFSCFWNYCNTSELVSSLKRVRKGCMHLPQRLSDAMTLLQHEPLLRAKHNLFSHGFS